MYKLDTPKEVGFKFFDYNKIYGLKNHLGFR